MDVYDIRRENFRRLVEEHWGGKRLLVAQDLGFAEVNLVTRYLSQGASRKPIGAAQARKIEARANRPRGWMDVAHGSEDPPPSTVNAKPARSVQQRIDALPAPLRHYLLLELEKCERLQHLIPGEFMKAPSVTNLRAFQEYLNAMVDQVQPRKIA